MGLSESSLFNRNEMIGALTFTAVTSLHFIHQLPNALFYLFRLPRHGALYRSRIAKYNRESLICCRERRLKAQARPNGYSHFVRLNAQRAEKSQDKRYLKIFRNNRRLFKDLACVRGKSFMRSFRHSPAHSCTVHAIYYGRDQSFITLMAPSSLALPGGNFLGTLRTRNP